MISKYTFEAPSYPTFTDVTPRSIMNSLLVQ